jgi:hypothetical protein
MNDFIGYYGNEEFYEHYCCSFLKRSIAGVRGQDVWLSKGAEQTRQILSAWCDKFLLWLK